MCLDTFYTIWKFTVGLFIDLLLLLKSLLYLAWTQGTFIYYILAQLSNLDSVKCCFNRGMNDSFALGLRSL